uniref:RRM domain-containing protein n=2 Tax=Arion vulgaris TaxID=1028688 RepID=A0A0B7A7V0_9EUPU
MTIKIFLGNLSSDTTSDKIRPLFEKYGEVVECDVLKNFGFVHMVNKNEANKAIAQLDGYNIDGNNIRVELSTGKKGGGGGGGKFDKKGFGGAGRSRPYGMQGRGDYDRYPYPSLPPVPPYDRYDPYYRYYLEREAYYARLNPLTGERGYPSTSARDRYPLPRDRLTDRYAQDPRDRIIPPRSYIDERSRGLPEPYFRERDPMAARPPPEYYDSLKQQMS